MPPKQFCLVELCKQLRSSNGRKIVHQTPPCAGEREHGGLVSGAPDGCHHPKLRALQPGGPGGGVRRRYAADERQHHARKAGAVGAGLSRDAEPLPCLGSAAAGASPTQRLVDARIAGLSVLFVYLVKLSPLF